MPREEIDPMTTADAEQETRDRMYDDEQPAGSRFLPDGPINPALLAPADDAIASIPDLHQRWLDDPRFHALVALILDVRDTVHRAGHLPSEDALRIAARAELIVRPAATPEPEPTRSPDDGEPTGPRYSECATCHGPIERFTPPGDLFWSHFEHPADEHDALPVPRWTFDRPGFMLSIAMAPGETTDLSRLADLAEAAIR